MRIEADGQKQAEVTRDVEIQSQLTGACGSFQRRMETGPFLISLRTINCFMNIRMISVLVPLAVLTSNTIAGGGQIGTCNSRAHIRPLAADAQDSAMGETMRSNPVSWPMRV